MKLLLTGGTGFIGSAILRELSKHGHETLLISRDKNKAQEQLEKKGIKNAEIINLDLTKPIDFSTKEKINGFKPETLIHAAWEGIPDYGYNQSHKNIEIGLSVYSLAKEAGCTKIITTGTCAEYGALEEEVKEDAPIHVPAPGGYQGLAAAKTSLMNLGALFAKETDISFIWTRPFFVYGPGMRKAALLPYLLNTKKEKNTPELKNPKAGHDFIFVTDVISCLIALTEQNTPAFGIYNIGSGLLTPDWQMVKTVFGSLPSVIAEEKNIQGFWANISKVRQELNWSPRVSLEEGIQLTAKSFGVEI